MSQDRYMLPRRKELTCQKHCKTLLLNVGKNLGNMCGNESEGFRPRRVDCNTRQVPTEQGYLLGILDLMYELIQLDVALKAYLVGGNLDTEVACIY